MSKHARTYKGVFLDWDDTIGDWNTAEHKALRDIYEAYHLDALYPTLEDYIAAYKPYNLELWGRYGRGEVSKETLHFERFYRPLQGLNIAAEQKVALAHEIGDAFLQLTNKHFTLMPDAERVIPYLAAKYPLTIVSNGFREVQYYKFAHSGLERYLTHTLISDEIGINKPQPELFRIALARNGLQADEVIMIGDSYSSDIQGAKNAGIDQLWIRMDNDHPADDDQTATFIVHSLAEVMNIL